jgi:hypothetical protein
LWGTSHFFLGQLQALPSVCGGRAWMALPPQKAQAAPQKIKQFLGRMGYSVKRPPHFFEEPHTVLQIGFSVFSGNFSGKKLHNTVL